MFFHLETSKPFEWIKKLKDEDRIWARAYLSKKGVHISETDFEPGFNKSWMNDATHREIDQQTRNAWRQRKARKSRTGKKAYNFVLTNDAKRKLDIISANMHCSITDALVNVIEHESKRIDEHKALLSHTKEQIKKTKKALEQESTNTLTALKQLTYRLQKELDYTLINLAFKNLKIQNSATLHTPLEALKDRVIDDFHTLRLKSTINIGPISIGLPAYPPNTEELWNRLIEAAEA